MGWILPIVLLGVALVYLLARARPLLVPRATSRGDGASLTAPALRINPSHTRQSAAPVPAMPVTPPLVSSVVAGRVQTESGRALAGTRICTVDANADCCASMACTVSDAAGQFVVHQLGDLALTLLASHPGYLPVTERSVEPIGAAPVVLTMRAGGVVMGGRVVDASGGPIAGAWLSASNARGALSALAVSNGAGLFQLDVAAGMTRIAAGAEGYSEQVQELEAPLEGVQLVLAAESSIVGRVVIEDTRLPSADAIVTAVVEDGLRMEPRLARTTEEGTFRIGGLPPGRYSLEAVSRHWRSDQRLVALGVAQISEPIELRVSRATPIEGMVQVDGVPCQRGSVAVQGAIQLYAQLAQDGSVAFDAVPPGRYSVNVSCQGALAQTELLDVELTPLTRIWELGRGLQLRGVALSPEGTPLAGAHIDVCAVGEPAGRRNSDCITDERGEFSCTGLAPGTYDCRTGPGDPPRSNGVLVAVSPESAPRVVLHAHDEGAIRVSIAHSERFELPTLAVVARGAKRAVVGELRGNIFVFEPLALGTYEVAIESAPPGSGRPVELRRPGQILELTLALPSPDTISGRVVDEKGQAVPDAWVRVAGTSPYAQFRPMTPVLTDGEGAFSVMGLVPARYQLSVSSAAGRAEIDEVGSASSSLLVTVRDVGAPSGSSPVAEATGATREP